MLKRTIMLLLAAATFALAACGTSPTASLTFGDQENPGRVTGVSGLESQDVANIANYGTYANTVATKAQKKVCEIKAKQGETISMSGVDSISCYAPEPDQVAKPTQAEGKPMQMARAIREGVGGTLKDATPVLLGGMALNDRNNARSSAERINESNNVRAAAADAAAAERERAVIDALSADPDYFVLPPGAAPVAPITP